MYLMLGLVTILAGISAAILLPDNPMTAKFLTIEQRAYSIKRIAGNQTGIENRHFKPRHILELLPDLQIWLLCLLTILVSAAETQLSTWTC